jgi:uncharacterized protein YjbI with pentapeptide repeats
MVDEHRKRIPQPWLWALAGAALVGVFVFVLVVAPSLLIPHPKTGLSTADELKARNDVRTTLVQALAGLAVAGGLLVTYRTYRQNRAEQDRTYERELYAKAVEQLGHEKAPVRLGALYSLERLAEDKPERRQIIVDVICAYLRMPFSPATPASKLKPGNTEDLKVTESHTTDGISDAWQQERQVRLTAQRVLGEHLRMGLVEHRRKDRVKEQRSSDPLNPHFWPDIRLDLVGATLIDFNLQAGVIADADFSGAVFTGDAQFGRVIFGGTAAFSGATFNDVAWFGDATFSRDAWFDETTFNRTANFYDATFTGLAGFRSVTFSHDALFGGATISHASFSKVTFSLSADFREVAFSSVALFSQVTFSGNAAFAGATFSRSVGFRSVIFSGPADFAGATFSRGDDWLSFGESRVTSPDVQRVWPTGWRLGPDSNGGYTVVRANDDGLS